MFGIAQGLGLGLNHTWFRKHNETYPLYSVSHALLARTHTHTPKKSLEVPRGTYTLSKAKSHWGLPKIEETASNIAR